VESELIWFKEMPDLSNGLVNVSSWNGRRIKKSNYKM